jgi:peptide/nickel transport system substrate-binding protein
MQTDIPFSGGPWILKSFTLGKIVLVPNDKYYGRGPVLDQVTILPLSDSAPAPALLRGGTIDAFPWPPVEGFLDQFSGDKNIRAVAGGGFGFEALWFNHAAPPLADPRVREALMYAIDRQAAIDQVIRRIDPQAQVLNCGFLAVPNLGPCVR